MNKDYYLKLRNKYFPKELKFILVLESPPVSGKYFYDETGKTSEPLFNELMKALNYKPIAKKDGLKFFSDQGFFLVDATYKPINKLKGVERNNTILSDFDNLVADLENSTPEKQSGLILVKANICRLLENELQQKGFNVLNQGAVIPFPSTGQQKRFQTEFQKILNKYYKNA
ncbi:MAG: hypothetical protein PF690_18775 [Deltaproteobacteria bacterium]|jgi:hypothetical protein|nr:hypothetical protein [Deltaproteobacteria bacterium]